MAAAGRVRLPITLSLISASRSLILSSCAHNGQEVKGVSRSQGTHITVGTFYHAFNSVRASCPLPLDMRRMKIVLYVVSQVWPRVACNTMLLGFSCLGNTYVKRTYGEDEGAASSGWSNKTLGTSSNPQFKITPILSKNCRLRSLICKENITSKNSCS